MLAAPRNKPRKVCQACYELKRPVSACRPQGEGKKCWTCTKFVRECSFVTSYPASLKGYIPPSDEERRSKRVEKKQKRQLGSPAFCADFDEGDGNKGCSSSKVSIKQHDDDDRSASNSPSHSPSNSTAVKEQPPLEVVMIVKEREDLVLYPLAGAVAARAAEALGDHEATKNFAVMAASMAADTAANVALLAWAAGGGESPLVGKRSLTESAIVTTRYYSRRRIDDHPVKEPSKELFGSSQPVAQLSLLAATAEQAKIKSIALSVPAMMCLGACGAAIESTLSRLPDTSLAAIDVPKRIVHCHSPCQAGTIVAALAEIGFESTVLSISDHTANLATGSRRESNANIQSEEWEIADALGLVSASCHSRTGQECSCGPACLCHYCPTHHPQRAKNILENQNNATSVGASF